MRKLLIILAFLALLASLVFILVLNQSVPAIALLVAGCILLVGTLLGRKAAAHSLILFCTILVVLISGVAFYETQGFARAESAQPIASAIWGFFGLVAGSVLAVALAFGVLLLSSDYIFADIPEYICITCSKNQRSSD